VGLRVLLGIGEAIVTPASMRWIRFNVPESQRGLAVGIYMAGTKYGPGIGIPVAASLSTGYGWQNMFLILGLGGMVWLIPWILMVRNDDRALASEAAAKVSGPTLPFGDVFKTPLIYGVIVGTFCYNYFVFFSMTWLPAYLVEQRGMTPDQMGIIASASFGGMGTVAILAGLVADRMIARGFDAVKVRKGFTLAGLGLASTELIGALSSDTNVAMIFAVISLAGLGLATANYWALTQTLIPGGALSGRIAGVQNFASNVSGIVAPLLTGWLKQVTGSYEVPMAFIFGLLVLGICSYVFLVRERYVPRLVTA
jgi:MFS family permease